MRGERLAVDREGGDHDESAQDGEEQEDHPPVGEPGELSAGPLIFWLIYKDKDQLVRNAAAGSFNFAVTLTIVSWVAGILQFTVILAPLGWLLWIIVFVGGLVLGIIAALAASRYELYTYPLTIPILT
ncbi:DUF4870 domain-containing protein [Brachybacterium sp. AOP25-B2-12]|uniref:DUF4870 domain-containing protein n=1 Tax=Brachybacterium sp. AOP25-B2-12 TaxID=3457710 RepID=UPI004033650A